METNVQFLIILGIGIIIPLILKSNNGFNLVNSVECGVNDEIHNHMIPLSNYIRQHPKLQQILTITSSLLIDIQYILMVLAIAKRRKLIYALPFFQFYSLRWFIQRITYLPVINQYIWDNPRFPSLTIFYEYVGDYFPSGHVGFIVLCCLLNKKLGLYIQYRLALIQLFYQTLFVLVTRTHYTIDIIGGFAIAYFCWNINKRYLFPCKIQKYKKILKVINIANYKDQQTQRHKYATATESE